MHTARAAVLNNDNRTAVNTGLKYVNNDACYPSLMVVGQIMDAVTSGKYDMSQTAVLISQTGGGCRASNYIGYQYFADDADTRLFDITPWQVIKIADNIPAQALEPAV